MEIPVHMGLAKFAGGREVGRMIADALATPAHMTPDAFVFSYSYPALAIIPSSPYVRHHTVMAARRTQTLGERRTHLS